MNRLVAVRRYVSVLAAAVGLSLLPASSLFAAPVQAGRVASDDPAPPVIRLTAAAVDSSNRKIAAAYDDLVSLWSSDFKALGARFAAPRIARYREPIRTSCGVMDRNNAGYCLADNTIYYDDVFVAAQGKRAASALGTDGDMASLGVIAHEMGHAVAMQLGHVSRYAYENESTADCLAGVFAKHAQEEGMLEQGDLEEAFYGMSTAGDPTPELTGDARMDRRILTRAALMGHGTRDQRMQNFRTGLEGGAGACLAEFRQMS